MEIGIEERLCQHLADGVVAYDPDTGTILTLNDTCCRLLGYEKAELVGEPLSEIVGTRQGTDTRQKRIDDYTEHAQRDKSVQFTWWAETADGDSFPVEAHVTVTEMDGRSVALATLRDVRATNRRTDDALGTTRGSTTVERHRESGARRDRNVTTSDADRADETPIDGDQQEGTDSGDGTVKSEAQYRRILDYLSDYVLIVDESGTITYSSPGVTSLGHEPENLIGVDAFKYVHPADRQATKADFYEMLDNPSAELSSEYRGQTADGTYRWTEARGSNYLDDPLIEGVLVTIRDITERKAYERRIETQNRMLERLASIVSHDLKTPVSTASKLVGLLRADVEGNASAEQTVDRLEAVLDDLRTFADHLPELARQGTHVEEPIECNLEEVAEAAWNAVDPESLELRVDGTCTLDGDPRRLRQVFQNLFDNVVTHAPDATAVTVGTMANGFYVEDNGPGIETPTDADVFEYGETTDDSSGIGLAIVQTIVEAHGWSVSATAAEGGGARFEIRTNPT